MRVSWALGVRGHGPDSGWGARGKAGAGVKCQAEVGKKNIWGGGSVRKKEVGEGEVRERLQKGELKEASFF